MTEPICEVIITADSEDWLINFHPIAGRGAARRLRTAHRADQIHLSLGRQHPR